MLQRPAPNVIRIEPIDHRVHANAKRIHAVQRAAYAQEAALIGATHFPPLERGVQQVVSADESFVAAWQECALVGVISTCADDERDSTLISSLVVAPAWQRQGIAKRLLADALARHGRGAIAVQTAAMNAPALALYAGFGFVVARHSLAGHERLALVRLTLSR